MYGLEAINQANGWAMAITGASIVFSGLVVLSLAVSQLHKVVGLVEKSFKKMAEKPAEKAEGKAADKDSKQPSKIVVPDQWPNRIEDEALLYSPLIERMGVEFELAELYKLSQANQFPHPHITICRLRENGFICASGEGVFQWENK